MYMYIESNNREILRLRKPRFCSPFDLLPPPLFFFTFWLNVAFRKHSKPYCTERSFRHWSYFIDFKLKEIECLDIPSHQRQHSGHQGLYLWVASAAVLLRTVYLVCVWVGGKLTQFGNLLKEMSELDRLFEVRSQFSKIAKKRAIYIDCVSGSVLNF